MVGMPELLTNLFNPINGFKKIFITQSCTSALEAAALILDIKHGDEIIVPSFNFVTSAAVFANFGSFGEVWASDLTKCEAENSQIVVLGAFS